MANPSVTDILEDFVGLFFPRYCAGCDDALARGEQLICTRCILEMPRTGYHLEIDNPFYQKLRVRLPVQYVVSMFRFVKAGAVQNILHTLKYQNKPELGQLLGKIYGNELMASDYSGKFDLIVPVPLHKNKKRLRGYNQSEEFGKGLGESLMVPCSDEIMKRLQVTTTQTKKSRLRRWENVKEVFAVDDIKSVAGKRILLVDDVVTTGATLEAAGRILLEHGCSALSIACIAATQ